MGKVFELGTLQNLSVNSTLNDNSFLTHTELSTLGKSNRLDVKQINRFLLFSYSQMPSVTIVSRLNLVISKIT